MPPHSVGRHACGELRHRPEHPLPFAGVWLCCDQCDRWCHAECAGIDGATIDDAEDYTCPRCLGGVAEEGSSSGEGEDGAAAESRGDGRKRRRGAARLRNTGEWCGRGIEKPLGVNEAGPRK